MSKYILIFLGFVYASVTLQAQEYLSPIMGNPVLRSLDSKVKKQKVQEQYLTLPFIDDFSTENILCQCIKQILDREFKIKYPNRNKISKSLFNVIGTIKHMSDFTIVKFDFKDYFNSISSVYVYDKIMKSNLSLRCGNFHPC